MDGKDFRQIQVVVEALRRHRTYQELLEGRNPFLIYKVSNRQVLAKGIYGYDAAVDAAKQLRQRHQLKYEDLKIVQEKNFFKTGYPQKSRIDYSSRYNPSKRGRFRVRMNPDGSTADID